MILGPVDEDEQVEAVGRDYWEKRASKDILGVADKILRLIHTFNKSYQLNYNKFHIGLLKDGKANNFVLLHPRKSSLRIGLRMSKDSEKEDKIDELGLDPIDYTKSGRYRIRLSSKDVDTHKDYLIELLKGAYEEI